MIASLSTNKRKQISLAIKPKDIRNKSYDNLKQKGRDSPTKIN